jgi:hypothetical protein
MRALRRERKHMHFKSGFSGITVPFKKLPTVVMGRAW